MNLLSFFRRVLPEGGIYCSATRKDNGSWVNVAHHSLEALATACINVSASGRDVWYATAAYAEEETYDQKQERYRFMRTQANVAKLQALRLDIDVHPTKEDAYPDIKSALGALKDFVLTTKLPLPLVVNSGYGLHIYWPFSAPIDAHTWLALAEKLRAICAGLGFKVDHSGTTDSARVLRPPTTFNYKRGGKKEVRVLLEGHVSDVNELTKQLNTAVAPYQSMVKAVRPLKAPPKFVLERCKSELAVRMLAVLEALPEEHTRVVGPIVKGCQQVRESGTQAEPVWHRMISLLKLCHRGEEAIHILSKQDKAQYDEAVVNAKIADTKPMPTTCAEFNRLRPGVCEGCQHWQTITSPIQLGVKPVEVVKVEQPPIQEPAVTPDDEQDEHDVAPSTHETTHEVLFDLPSTPLNSVVTFNATEWRDTRYEVNENGCWMIVVDDTGTKKKQLAPYVIKPISITRSIKGERTIRWYMYFDKDKPEVVETPMATIHDQNSVITAFSTKGLTLADAATTKAFSEFVRSYYFKIKIAGAMMEYKRYTHMGWGDDHEFVLGDKVVYPDGLIADLPDLDFNKWETLIVQEGDLSKWVGAVNHMFTPKEMAKPALMFLHGFSAPLMNFFFGTETTLTFVVGETGVGKSTLASLMWSIWSKPFAFPKGAGDLNASTGSTMNSLFRDASILHSLPLYIDEATLWDPARVASYVYDISSGQEKKRLDSSSKQQEAGSWRTTAMATSNISLKSKLVNAMADCSPHLMRIIEFHLPRVNYGTKYVEDIKTMHANYGNAGLHYARYLTKNAATGRLQEMLNVNRDMITKRFNMRQEERYWTSWATCIYTGMELARAAGLHAIDADTILKTMHDIIEEQRGGVGVVEASRYDWVGEFFSDMWPHTVVVANSVISKPNGHPDIATVRVPSNTSILVRANVSTGVCYASAKAVRSWCANKGISYESFTNVLNEIAMEQGIFEKTKTIRYGLGTGVRELQSSTPPIACLKIKQSIEAIEARLANDTEEQE